jgi:carboxylesterase
VEREQQSVDPDRGVARTGVLLVHGLNGSTHDMEELASYLVGHNLATKNMLLPGHGTKVRDMLAVGWSEWATAVQNEYHLLRESCAQVFVAGHSLGGALCLHLAAHEEVAGVIAMCTPLRLFPWMRPAVGLVRHITPLLPTVREDIRDAQARKRYGHSAYRWTPLPPLQSLFHFLPCLCSELPDITAPALIMAAQHDHVVPVQDGIEIYQKLGSQDKHLLILHKSYHVVMKDYDRETVFKAALNFIQSYREQQGSRNILEQLA